MKYSLKQFVNKVFGRIEHLLTAPRLRVLKTIYVNYRSLPFTQAIHLPIYVYGKVKIHSLKGTMEIKGPIKKGMIKIGMPTFGPVIDYFGSFLLNDGKIIFEGEVIICNNCTISVYNGATLVLKNKAYFAEKVRVVCSNYIEIGEGTRIIHESQLMDTNFHYIIDLTKDIATYPKGEIVIGKWSWISNRTTIQKGTILPDYTIVGSNSLLNKNYSDIPPFSLLGGMPAKLIKTGLRRVFNIESEKMLNNWFLENGEDAKYKYIGKDIDAFCQ